MATFVIVHGAWSGGHAWRRVRPGLRAAGHEVFTPAPTGLAERAHLAGPDVDLDTHVQDVVNVLEYEDLQEVHLVGHSYGGVVITAAAEHVADRLAQLVYLDAEVPEDGQSEYDLIAPEERAAYEEGVHRKGDRWRIPPPVPEPLPDDLPPDIRWTLSRMAPSPPTPTEGHESSAGLRRHLATVCSELMRRRISSASRSRLSASEALSGP